MLKSQTSIVSFEIGVVYRSQTERYYLAVDKQSLITIVHDVVIELDEPTNKFSVVRTMSVEKLCHTWGITLDRLDEISAVYFAPTRSNRAKRRLPDKFSSKETYSQDMINILWAKHRTHRVAGTD
jgi:hypothetical protein